MGNLSYIESINKQPSSFSLYRWVKQNPVKRIQLLYDDKTPIDLLKRADRFIKWFGKYPGDGVLFFHDDLLSPLSEVFPRYTYVNHPKEFNKFYNYLYSFASCFTIKSRGALAVFLFNCPPLTVSLYNYRKNFDPDAFTNLIEKISVYKSFNEYTKGDAGKYITQFIWETIFSNKIALNVCDNNVFMHLYYGYTYTAIQRFFFLSTSKAALKEHIDIAYNKYKETGLLMDCWTEDIISLYSAPNRVIPQMSSIKAMERFHDLKAEEILEQQRALDTHQYLWEILSNEIKEASPEWYLPEFASDILIRGQQHHNCVGSYVERHYKPVEDNFKMLLLFTDFCEAEAHLSFGQITIKGKTFLGCNNVKIMQAKTAYNKDISKTELLELKEVIKVFLKKPAEIFNPVIRDKMTTIT